MAFEILRKNSNSVFGFIGQWDEVDVLRKSEQSQRFRIYKRATLSILSKANHFSFNYLSIEEINALFIFPEHVDSIEVEIALKKQFSAIYTDEQIAELFMPSI